MVSRATTALDVTVLEAPPDGSAILNVGIIFNKYGLFAVVNMSTSIYTANLSLDLRRKPGGIEI